MSLGVSELVLLAVVAVGTGWAIRRTGQLWLGVLPVVVLIASLFSPADPVSTLLIAVPNALLVGVAVRLAQRASSLESIGDV